MSDDLSQPYAEKIVQSITSGSTDAYFSQLLDEARNENTVPWQSIARLMFARANDLERSLTRIKIAGEELLACEEMRERNNGWRHTAGDPNEWSEYKDRLPIAWEKLREALKN